MKQKYVKVNAEIIEFETEDIITGSTVEDGFDETGDNGEITTNPTKGL